MAQRRKDYGCENHCHILELKKNHHFIYRSPMGSYSRNMRFQIGKAKGLLLIWRCNAVTTLTQFVVYRSESAGQARFAAGRN